MHLKYNMQCSKCSCCPCTHCAKYIVLNYRVHNVSVRLNIRCAVITVCAAVQCCAQSALCKCVQLYAIQCNSVCPVQWWFEHTAQHSAVSEHTCQLVSKPPAGSPATSIFLLDSCYCDWDFFAWFVLLLDSCYCDEDMTVSVVRSIWKGGLPVSYQEAARPHLFEAATAIQQLQQSWEPFKSVMHYFQVSLRAGCKLQRGWKYHPNLPKQRNEI